MSKEITYIDRDISWLDFNYRVLQEAKDPNVPLIERIKFLAIYSSNLDEFFRVRVANHRNLVRIGKKTKKELDYKPEKVLEKILHKVNKQQVEFSKIFEKEIIPDLRKENINVLKVSALNDDQKNFVANYFNENLLPYVQPVLLRRNKIKPFLNNGSLYLALWLKDREKDKEKDQFRYAIVKIPSKEIKRLIELPPSELGKHDLILMDDIVRLSARSLFPGYKIMDSYSIKLTRDAELYIDDEFKGDLLDKVKRSLKKRNIGPASRMVYDREMPDHLLEYLSQVFDLTKYDLLPEGRYHNNSDFFKFPDFGKSHLRDDILPPIAIPMLEEAESIFNKISEKDYLIHVPYHSYESVVKFFEDAADDPAVSHIKIVQYRVAKKSRIMKALIRAVKKGKQVSAFIEIKARFDEEANIEWGEKLEQAGVKVHYSMPGLKVHAKMAVVRRIEDGERFYAYMSTGNFHEDTARVYSDFGVLTANPDITSECMRLFAYLETSQVPISPFKTLGVGQFNLNDMLYSLVQSEIDEAKAGRPAEILLKLNSLQDPSMINLLYKASQLGVKIQMIVRGICSLVPGIPGHSENIEVVSIVDRYLEHARIYRFYNAGKEKMYLSSADWMKRNLHHRIETMFPILDPEIHAAINITLKYQLNDSIKARKVDLKKTNEYRQTTAELATRSQIETYYFIRRYTNKLKA